MPNSLSHLLIAAVVLLLNSSCASSLKPETLPQKIKQESLTEFRTDYLQPKDVVWEAVMEAFKGIPIDQLDTREGYVESDWMEGSAGERKQRRLKLIVYVKETRLGTSKIEMIGRAEERKADHKKWKRVPSNGELEKNIFENIEKILQ